MSCSVTKPRKWHVHPAKTHISLGICPVWSISSLCTQWVAKDPTFLHVDSKDSDQTGRTPRLIWVFEGHTGHFVGFVVRRLTYNPLFWVFKTLRFQYSGNFTKSQVLPFLRHLQILPTVLRRHVWANSIDPEQTAPDQSLHCLPFHLRLLDALLCGKTTLFKLQ